MADLKNSRRKPGRELEAAREYYSYFGVGLVAVGALIGVVTSSLVMGSVAMVLGALAAALGTIAPESLCLSIARVDQPFQDFLLRDEDRDDEA